VNQIQPFTSVFLLALVSILIFLGLGQRVLDRMRLTDTAALLILAAMIAGHFFPTISLGLHLRVNLGSVALLGIAAYLLLTTSPRESASALGISLATALLVVITDKVLPPDPGLLDPVFSAGIFAGLLAYLWNRSRRGAFIAGILGVFLADLVAFIQLLVQGINQPIVLGSGGMFSSAVICPFLAVFIAEVIGEVREFLHKGTLTEQGGDDSE